MGSPEWHECTTCGYRWEHGKDGGHWCPNYMFRHEVVKSLAQRVEALEERAAWAATDRGDMALRIIALESEKP